MEKVKSNKSMDMLSGSLWDKILKFALPLAASSILQQLFNSADLAVVGRFSGSRAMAAVGSNGPIINLLINIFVGLSVGANVVIARYIGANNNEKVKRATHTTISIAIISGFIIMIMGLLVTRPILNLISTPPDIIDLATVYLRIYFLGMPFIMLYNFGSAILRSRGDTKRPFLCLLVSGIVNVFLNLFFVIVCHMSVEGVGIATVVANIISSGMLLYFLTHEKGILKINLKELKIDLNILKEIIKIGLPAGIQGMVFSFSNICIQSGLNSLGSDAVAGSAAALNFEYLAYFLLNAFSQASVTFTGQNFGAGDYKRCTRVTLWCVGLGFIFTMTLSSIFVIFGNSLIKIYTTEPAVMELALVRMRYILLFQGVNAAMDVLSGSMRGMGYSFVPALMSIIGVCGVRLVWVYTIFKMYPTFQTLVMVYPISWIATTIAIFTAYMVVRKIAMKPKLKKSI